MLVLMLLADGTEAVKALAKSHREEVETMLDRSPGEWANRLCRGTVDEQDEGEKWETSRCRSVETLYAKRRSTFT